MTQLLPTTATANVENGSDVVEVVGAVLTDINCRPGAQLAIAGLAYFAKERVDTTHFKLTRNYAGETAEGVDIEIGVFTPEMANRTELSKDLRTFSALNQLLAARGNGIHMISLGDTGLGDPGPGKVSYVGANWNSATDLCIDVFDAVGRNRKALIMRLKLGDVLIAESIATSAYVAYELGAAPTSEDSDAWIRLTDFILVQSDGAIVDDEAVRLVIMAAGVAGPGYEYALEVDGPEDLEALEEDATDGMRVWVENLGTAFGAQYNNRNGVVAWNKSIEDWLLKAVYTGPKGDQGDKGWSPQLVTVIDGERTVFQLSGYVGGAGDAPTASVGLYLKADGTFTATIGDALDVTGKSFNFRGAYGSGTTYAKRDVARDQGASWIAKQATTGNAPPTLPTTSNSYWEVMVLPGSNGAGTVADVIEGTGIAVDSTDPTQPVVSLSAETVENINSKASRGNALAYSMLF